MPRDLAPLALGFADRFDQLGAGDLRYSVAAQALTGRRYRSPWRIVSASRGGG
jgi:hypothetical protein